VLWIYNLSVN